MEKVISELFKALRKERGSLEAETSRFGTHNIMNFLGNLRGVLFVLLFLAWFFIILLVSCGSSKLTSSEKVRANETTKVSQGSTVQASTTMSLGKERSTANSISTTKEREEVSSENSETTIYDTGDTASNAKQKVSKTIKQTKIEKHGMSLPIAQKETTNKTSVEVTKEKENKNTDTQSSSSATIDKRKESECLTDKAQSVSESKQTLFIALTFFGVALVLLVGILAHWVFSKYRRQS